jgi:hypothetical protein
MFHSVYSQAQYGKKARRAEFWKERHMRLIFATIIAAAGIAALSTPALADHGERGHGSRDYSRHDDGERGRNHDGERGRDWNRDRGRDWHSDRGRRDHRDWNRYSYRDGRNYWGPSGQHWSSWNNSWGDPHRYARQWGFDRYDHNRGWQRGNTWYASPNQWSDWGGWNWSFSVGNGGFHNGYNYNDNGFGNANCGNYRTQDWINGRQAIVTYVGCADRYGRIFEQPGTRRVERWVW